MSSSTLFKYEEIVNLIYNSCRKSEEGVLRITDLITYLQESSCINDEVKKSLERHFKTDLVDCNTFRTLMLSWISSQSNIQYFEAESASQNEELCEDEMNENRLKSSLDIYEDSIFSTYNNRHNREMDELHERISMAEEKNKKLVQEHMSIQNIAEDMLQRQCLEHEATIKKQQNEIDEMRHRKKDMEVMLDRLQNDLDVLQASFNDLETDCTNKQHQLNNLQDKLEQEQLMKIETEDNLEKVKQNLKTALDENMKNQNDCVLYRALYNEKSRALEIQHKTSKELALQVEELQEEIEKLEKEIQNSGKDVNNNNTTLDSISPDNSLICSSTTEVFFTPQHTNTPSLFNEISDSLLGAAAFPSPLRDSEVQSLLDGRDENYCDDDSDGKIRLMRLEGKRVEVLRQLSCLLQVARDKPSNLEAHKSSLAENVVSHVRAKLEAELNFIKLKSHFSQKLESLEVDQVGLREHIKSLQNELISNKEEMAMKISEKNKNLGEIKIINGKLIEQNSSLKEENTISKIKNEELLYQVAAFKEKIVALENSDAALKEKSNVLNNMIKSLKNNELLLNEKNVELEALLKSRKEIVNGDLVAASKHSHYTFEDTLLLQLENGKQELQVGQGDTSSEKKSGPCAGSITIQILSLLLMCTGFFALFSHFSPHYDSYPYHPI